MKPPKEFPVSQQAPEERPALLQCGFLFLPFFSCFPCDLGREYARVHAHGGYRRTVGILPNGSSPHSREKEGSLTEPGGQQVPGTSCLPLHSGGITGLCGYWGINSGLIFV